MKNPFQALDQIKAILRIFISFLIASSLLIWISSRSFWIASWLIDPCDLLLPCNVFCSEDLGFEISSLEDLECINENNATLRCSLTLRCNTELNFEWDTIALNCYELPSTLDHSGLWCFTPFQHFAALLSSILIIWSASSCSTVSAWIFSIAVARLILKFNLSFNWKLL